ncbi:DNA-binding LacI/PurR family transcriptional regulator [Hamadaea flava]|uniref:LacI family DNA-binding transcriptional regulator n=1 Tax=Hamadaea flava TaxID=1742688 RepID=A0ABV8LUX6_9ACTN|nr:LacI family DNA-binding transcriptional regulator [Hamadaea flava]MCP2322222.1 DNA-binding LacI/PurR family transcriptional regulator [Hamadaea flava]
MVSNRGRRPRQIDVAKAANVSTAIVSAVISSTSTGTIRVSEETRRRVLKAAEDLGYVPNVAARSLAGGRSHLIGAFTYQQHFPRESRDFYFEFLLGIEEAAEDAGYNLLLFTGTRDDSGNRTVYRNGSNMLQLADGSIMVGGQVDPKELARLHAERYPFVMVGRRDSIPDGVSWVAADYRSGTAEVVRKLAELGHRRIAFVQGALTHETVDDRRAGFAEVGTELGWPDTSLPVLTYDTAGGADANRPRTLLSLARRRKVTALVFESNYLADQVRTAAASAGVDVPGQLSVVALGDWSERNPGQQVAPGLAELTSPSRQIGREAVAMLIRLLGSQTTRTEHVMMPCTITTGSTIAPPPSS